MSLFDSALPQGQRPQDRPVVRCGWCDGTGIPKVPWMTKCTCEGGYRPRMAGGFLTYESIPSDPLTVKHYCPQGCVSSCPED